MDGKGAGNRIAILLQGQADGKREGDPCRRSYIPVECCGVQAGLDTVKSLLPAVWEMSVPDTVEFWSNSRQCCCCLARRGWSRRKKVLRERSRPLVLWRR